MIILSVLYPKTSESHFDHEYYVKKHMPLVKSRMEPMGLLEVELMKGVVALDGSPAAYELVGNIRFGSMEQMQAALAAVAGELIADIPNFTNVQPVMLICDPVGL